MEEYCQVLDGLVTTVNIEPGMNTIPNQVIFEIVNTSSSYRVVWHLPAEKSSSFTVGNEVSLEITGEVAEDEKP